jgi:hypothetical protein
MATANLTTPTQISDIQRRMAQIRHEMHQDVQGAVKGAHSLTDWRSLVRSHPWLALGIATAAGYLIVPKRRIQTRTVVAASGPPPEALPVAAASQAAPAMRARASTIGTVFSLVAPVAIRAAQNFALKRFEEWLERHPLHPSATGRGKEYQPGSPPAAPTGPLVGFRGSR